MDSRLKQRLIGAAVLVALAVIFLPMLVQGPAPDSGVSDVPLSMPAPPRNDYETRDLPLVAPGDAPHGGAVGMAPKPTAEPSVTAPAPAAVTPIADASSSPPLSPSPPAPVAESFPAAVAGGDYAVGFGSYATLSAADAAVATLRAAQLPGYREQTTLDGKSVWRVRVGPYASQAAAEAARLRVSRMNGGGGAAHVVVLDAPAKPAATPLMAAAAKSKPATPAAVAPSPASTPAAPPQPPLPTASPPPSLPAATPGAAASVGFAVQLAAYSKTADADALRDKLQAAGINAFTEAVDTEHGKLTRVRAGPVQTRAQAEQLQAQIKARLGLDGVIRSHP